MEPLSILANLLLSVTVGTLAVALIAYIGYKLREKRRPLRQAPRATAGQADELVFVRRYQPPPAAAIAPAATADSVTAA